MSADMQASIVNMLSLNMQTLTHNLKELRIVINFLSAMKHLERDNSLLEYMEATFGRVPSYLTNGIKLKHVAHVWLVVKFTQTDLLMRKQQVLSTIPSSRTVKYVHIISMEQVIYCASHWFHSYFSAMFNF